MPLINFLKNERIIHSLKTAFAVFLGFLIIKSSHLPVDQWLIITIIVVMCAQINVGSMLQKSISRLAGTFTGSLIAILTIAIFGNSLLSHSIAITIAVLYFSYLATGTSRWSDSGTLGAVTCVIILINPTPTILLGIYRTLEIVLGIIIAALVSQIILPIHARTYLLREQIMTLTKIRQLYSENFLQHHRSEDNMHVMLDEQIIKSLITQRKLVVDAAREPFSKKHFIVRQFSNILLAEREILRSIDFMHYAYIASPENIKFFSENAHVKEFHEKITETFKNIIDHVQTKRSSKLIVNLPTLDILKEVVTDYQQTLSQEAKMNSDAFLFCSKILLEKTQDLIDCLRL